MNANPICSAIIHLIVLSLFGRPLITHGDLRVHGSSTLFNALYKEKRATIEEQTQAKLELIPNGSGNGFLDLVKGQADMAMLSSDIESIIKSVQPKLPGTTLRLEDYKTALIGTLQVRFIINSKNTTTKLTREELVKILLGETTNWSLVGGPNLPIVIVTEQEGGGLRTTTEEVLLNKRKISPNARTFPSANSIAPIVSQIPGAIGIVSGAAIKDANIKKIAIDFQVEQHLYLVTKGTPNSEQAKFIEASQKCF